MDISATSAAEGSDDKPMISPDRHSARYRTEFEQLADRLTGSGRRTGLI